LNTFDARIEAVFIDFCEPALYLRAKLDNRTI